MTPLGRIVTPLLGLLLVVLTSTAQADECKSFTWYQKHMLQKAYDAGEPFNLGETMRAMAFLESSAGVNLANHRTRDYGLMGIHWRTASKRFPGITVDRLMYDHDFNLAASLAELEYWRGYTDNWRDLWASYNGGWTLYESNYEYADKVRSTIRLFRRCL